MSTGAFTLTDIDKPAGQFTAKDIDTQPTPYGKGTNVDTFGVSGLEGALAKTLSGAGLPTSIGNIPEWLSNLRNLNISHLFIEPVRKAIESPTQENIVGAVPFFGLAGVSMSKDVQAGKPQDALGTLVGSLGGLKAAGQVGPGLSAAGKELVRARGLISDVAEATKGHSLTATAIDKILPKAKETDFKGGAYSDYYGESGKEVPLTQSPKYPELQAAKRAAMKEARDKLNPPEPEPIKTDPFASMTSTASPRTGEVPQGTSTPFQPINQGAMTKTAPYTEVPGITSKVGEAPAESPQDLISRTRTIVKPGEMPTAAELKRAGDLTQVPLLRLQAMARFGDKLAENEIIRRIQH